MTTPIVRLTDITKRFGSFVAVHGLSLEIQKGEFISLLGPSGCGKTTTLRMIAGLENTSGGTIYIGGRDVTDVPPYRRNLGMVFQNYALFPHLTVAENVAFGLRRRGVGKPESLAKAEEMLNLVRLPGLGERMPAQLSGGQQQRVALARALAIDPEVLLLDEPLSNLDLKLRQELRLELKRIQRVTGITTIFVTHDQGEALSMSDRVVVMMGGKVIQEGSPKDLYDRPKFREVAAFLGDMNFFEGTVRDGRLVTPGGLALDAPRLAAREGQATIVAVRPERVALHLATDAGVSSGQNQVHGTLAATDYSGSVTRYKIELSDGTSVLADRTADQDFLPEDASEVILSWGGNDCVILEGEGKA